MVAVSKVIGGVLGENRGLKVGVIIRSKKEYLNHENSNIVELLTIFMIC